MLYPAPVSRNRFGHPAPARGLRPQAWQSTAHTDAWRSTGRNSQSSRPRRRATPAGSDVTAKVQTWLNGFHAAKLEALSYELDQLRSLLRMCESPLEQLLLTELIPVFAARVAGSRNQPYLRGHLIVQRLGRFSVTIRQQPAIAVLSASYRPDFLLTVERWDWKQDRHQLMVQMVVEVDGHRYHERTQAQAEHDRVRDRQLTAQGYRVVRFTGREVNRSATSAAQEVARLLTIETSKALA